MMIIIDKMNTVLHDDDENSYFLLLLITGHVSICYTILLLASLLGRRATAIYIVAITTTT